MRASTCICTLAVARLHARTPEPIHFSTNNHSSFKSLTANQMTTPVKMASTMLTAKIGQPANTECPTSRAYPEGVFFLVIKATPGTVMSGTYKWKPLYVVFPTADLTGKRKSTITRLSGSVILSVVLTV